MNSLLGLILLSASDSLATCVVIVLVSSMRLEIAYCLVPYVDSILHSGGYEHRGVWCSAFAGRITFAMTRSLRVQACTQWWRASGDDVKPSLGTWQECHATFQLTKHWDYRSRHQLVDDLTAIGSGALVVLATAGSTNSVRTISAHLLTYIEQPSGVVILERRYSPRWLRDDDGSVSHVMRGHPGAI